MSVICAEGQVLVCSTGGDVSVEKKAWFTNSLEGVPGVYPARGGRAVNIRPATSEIRWPDTPIPATSEIRWPDTPTGHIRDKVVRYTYRPHQR